MKILFCGLKYEYGDQRLGFSAIEYDTFFATLKRMPGIEVNFFGMDEIISQFGRDIMNEKLIREVEEKTPDLLFFVLFTDQIKPETIRYITTKTFTKTFNWFADDSWRFHIFSKYWAPLFTLSATTDPGAIKKYNSLGINNVIRTQWAANVEVYHPITPKTDRKYEVTFVGGKYGNRSSYISLLKERNIPVEAFGNAWPAGRATKEKMLEIFSGSKINLNFTETPYMTFKERLRAFSQIFLKYEKSGYRINLNNPWGYFLSALDTQKRQFKARIFEAPACGGFLLTGKVDGLSDYYKDGTEIVVFKGRKDLIEKCHYYLEHEEKRIAIAKAGYERTIKDHTYEQRFKEIFKALELM